MTFDEFNQLSHTDFCGRIDSPGLAVDFDLYVDYSQRHTTEDQARIETQLEQLITPDQCILHVGIGNSALAAKFCQRQVQVVGVTVSHKEVELANQLNIAGYQVFIANKYHRLFNHGFSERRFDYIVDNNLISFSCCHYHNWVMLENYLACLKVGGKILTDQRGMDWALASRDFILTFEDLCDLVKHLPVCVSRLTDSVYCIEKVAAPLSQSKAPIMVYAKRYDEDGKATIHEFSAS